MTNDGTHSVRSLGPLALRVGAGAMLMLGHGLGKLEHYPMLLHTFPDPLGIGSAASLTLSTFAEFFCAGAVAIGLFTRWAAIPVIVNMLVAGVLAHAGQPWARRELAFLYLVPFVVVALTGPGAWSADRWVGPLLASKLRRPAPSER